jgi:hypothetical protein
VRWTGRCSHGPVGRSFCCEKRSGGGPATGRWLQGNTARPAKRFGGTVFRRCSHRCSHGPVGRSRGYNFFKNALIVFLFVDNSAYATACVFVCIDDSHQFQREPEPEPNG